MGFSEFLELSKRKKKMRHICELVSGFSLLFGCLGFCLKATFTKEQRSDIPFSLSTSKKSVIPVRRIGLVYINAIP